MKTMRTIGMMLMAAMMAFCMSACTNENDDNSVPAGLDGGGARGASSITVNGTTFSVYHACWDAKVLNGSDTFYTLSIYNSSSLGGADPFDTVSIVYKVVNGSQTDLATGEFTSFDVCVSRLSSDDTKDKLYYGYSSEYGNAGKLKVTKSGSGYQIEFGAMKYVVEGSPEATTYDGTAFSFSGAVAKGLLVQ
jgi:hypothetical protein